MFLFGQFSAGRGKVQMGLFEAPTRKVDSSMVCSKQVTAGMSKVVRL